MSLRRSRLLLNVSLSVGIVVSGVLLAATPAYATHRPYAGPAPGSVTCNVTMKFKFDPPITSTSGPQDANYPQVVGALNSCSWTADPNSIIPGTVRITQSSFRGNLAGVPFTCADNDGVVSVTENSDVQTNFTVKWLGTLSGWTNAKFNTTQISFLTEEPSTDGSVGFLLPEPPVSNSNVTIANRSSFDDNDAGVASTSVNGTMTTENLSQLATMCTPNIHGVAKGIKGVTLAGSITIGTSGS